MQESKINQEQTIKLWRKCEDARGAALAAGQSETEANVAAAAVWNSWANAMLARKTEMEKTGVWEAELISFLGELKPKNAATAQWLNEARVNFSGLTFLQRVVVETEGRDQHKKTLRAETAPEVLQLTTDCVQFSDWIFPGNANFSNARFLANAWFANTQFTAKASHWLCAISSRSSDRLVPVWHIGDLANGRLRVLGFRPGSAQPGAA